jgi:hypothetical protein
MSQAVVEVCNRPLESEFLSRAAALSNEAVQRNAASRRFEAQPRYIFPDTAGRCSASPLAPTMGSMNWR